MEQLKYILSSRTSTDGTGSSLIVISTVYSYYSLKL